MKKVLSLFMAVVMLCTLTAGIDFSAYAGQQYEAESNDDYATANVVGIDNVVTGNLNKGEDVDCYKFIAPSAGKLSFDFIHKYTDTNDVNWEIRIYQYSNGEYTELYGTKISGTSNEIVSLPYVGTVPNGIYYVKVNLGSWGGNAVGLNYSISNSFVASDFYEKELNNDYYTATDMSLNNTYSGCLNKGEDADYFKITTATAGKLSFDFIHKYTDRSDTNWEVKIYQYSNGEYTELYGTKISGTSNEIVSLPYVGTVPNGIYYVKVNLGSWGGNAVGLNYSISNSFVASDFYEKELNNDYYTATPISQGSYFDGTMNSGGDNDFYKLELSTGTNLRLTFSHTVTSASDTNWEVRVYNYANGAYDEICDSKKVYGTDGDITVVDQHFQPGTYFIKVNVGSWGGNAVGLDYAICASPSIYTPSTMKSSSHTTSSVKVSWSYVPGASGYILQRYTGGNWVNIADTASTACTVNGLGSGSTNNFRVCAYLNVNGQTFFSDFAYLTAATKPKTVSLKSLKTYNKGHKIKVYWKKVSGNASGYQIYWAKDKNFKKIVAKKTVSGRNKTSYTGKNFTKGKKYYVKVRSYKTLNGKKYYGSWSKVKSIKAK